MWRLRVSATVWMGLGVLAVATNSACPLDRTTPERACRNASPGDPTCMSLKQLERWCAKQAARENLPQCAQISR